MSSSRSTSEYILNQLQKIKTDTDAFCVAKELLQRSRLELLVANLLAFQKRTTTMPKKISLLTRNIANDLPGNIQAFQVLVTKIADSKIYNRDEVTEILSYMKIFGPTLEKLEELTTYFLKNEARFRGYGFVHDKKTEYYKIADGMYNLAVSIQLLYRVINNAEAALEDIENHSPHSHFLLIFLISFVLGAILGLCEGNNLLSLLRIPLLTGYIPAVSLSCGILMGGVVLLMAWGIAELKSCCCPDTQQETSLIDSLEQNSYVKALFSGVTFATGCGSLVQIVQTALVLFGVAITTASISPTAIVFIGYGVGFLIGAFISLQKSSAKKNLNIDSHGASPNHESDNRGEEKVNQNSSSVLTQTSSQFNA